MKNGDLGRRNLVFWNVAMMARIVWISVLDKIPYRSSGCMVYTRLIVGGISFLNHRLAGLLSCYVVRDQIKGLLINQNGVIHLLGEVHLQQAAAT